MTREYLIRELIRILDAYEGSSPQFSNQGQALDGYSALANFIALAEAARQFGDTE